MVFHCPWQLPSPNCIGWELSGSFFTCTLRSIRYPSGPVTIYSKRWLESESASCFAAPWGSILNATKHSSLRLPVCTASSPCIPMKQQRRTFSYKASLKLLQWPFLKAEMIDYFRRRRPARDSTVNIEAKEWPRFASKEQIEDEGCVPAVIWKHGPERRICLPTSAVLPIAFDEPEAHLSLLFKGRLFRLHVGNWIEECVVSDVKADPVEKHLYFLKFARHVPGKVTEIDIPVTLVGMMACPAYIKGYHVETAMPIIRCEVVGDHIPCPFQVDVSKLKWKEPYAAITLRDIQHVLPEDGTVRFHRSYDLDTQEVVWTYGVGKIPEEPLPADWEDPNFLNKHGRRISLTYKGYKHKQ